MNSKLVDVINISPNKNSPRNHKIDTITIHCVQGQLTAKQLGDLFSKSSYKASSNYGIGSDNKIGLYVDENDRSWCSSSASNDNRSITIEVASDPFNPFYVKDSVLDKLIELLVDICKRNGIKKLLWKNDKNLIGQIDKQNMTIHKWFKNKECPGEYLLSKHPEIVKRVNEQLKIKNIRVGDKVKVINAVTTSGKPFKLWYDKYDVLQVKNDEVVIGIGQVITARIKKSNVELCY